MRVSAGQGKKLKTKASARLVPIHSAIRDELLAYRETRPPGNLWGLTKGRDGYTGAASKWFARKLDGVVDNPRKTFHSLRYSVADKLKARGVVQYLISSLLGHANSSMSTGTYGDVVQPGTLREIVELIEYRGEQQ